MTNRTKLPRVELLNIPHFRQGSFDSLCAYYVGAMMLCTFFPAEGHKFGELKGTNLVKDVTTDPLIKHSAKSDNDSRLALVDWFYKGKYLEDVTKILNSITRDNGTRFGVKPGNKTDHTFKTMCKKIDYGSPVMLGWSTPDYGSHAVLVKGYWRGKESWLIVNDPGSDQSEISWDSIKEQKTQNFEIGFVENHTGYRPMQRITKNEDTPILNQWFNERYEPVVGSNRALNE